MEKRLSYCKSCKSFYLIDVGKKCPKCGYILLSSVVTEPEWEASNPEQKKAYKASLKSLAETPGPEAKSTGAPGNHPNQNTNARTGNTANTTRTANSGNGAAGSAARTAGMNSANTASGNADYRVYSADYEKMMKDYRFWSIVILVIGIISAFAIFGQYAQLDAQGYEVDKLPFFGGVCWCIIIAVAGYYGMTVQKNPKRLNDSWVLFILVLVGTIIMVAVLQAAPGILCMIGLIWNIRNGAKLRKMQ